MKTFEIKWFGRDFRGKETSGIKMVAAVSSEIAYAKFHFNYPDYVIEEVKEVK